MIDIHAHILPGVDDGAVNLDMALDMADIAVSGGTRVIVATPHADLDNERAYFMNYFDERLYRRLIRFRQALEEEHIPLQVLFGHEIYTTRTTLPKMEDGLLIPINHSRYYLMEFSFGLDIHVMEKRLMRVLETGRIPIIAHPERYYAVQDRPEFLYKWNKAGCLIQINKGSILGRFGDECKDVCDYLMDHGLVTCIASDAHSSRFRTPFMGDVQDYLEDYYSYDIAKKLLFDNPLKIIENKSIAFTGIR